MVVVRDKFGNVRKRKSKQEIEDERNEEQVFKENETRTAAGGLSLEQKKARDIEVAQAKADIEATAAEEAPAEEAPAEAAPAEEFSKTFVGDLHPDIRNQLKPELIQTDEDGRQFVVSKAGETPENSGLSIFGSAVAGSIAGGALAASGAVDVLSSAVASFFAKAAPAAATATTKAAASGSRALGTNPRALGTNPRAVQAVLTAPAKLRGTGGFLSDPIKAGLSFFGASKAISLGSEVIFGRAKKMKTQIGQVGEQLTKLPEASSHGFHVVDGQIAEYTQSMALADIAEVKQELLNYQAELQQTSIANTYLKFNHDWEAAVKEVDKQLVEIGVAQSKVLEQVANPSVNLQATREYWRNVDLA
jgi:hypothetical protein